jgi:hypothetical protein
MPHPNYDVDEEQPRKSGTRGVHVSDVTEGQQRRSNAYKYTDDDVPEEQHRRSGAHVHARYSYDAMKQPGRQLSSDLKGTLPTSSNQETRDMVSDVSLATMISMGFSYLQAKHALEMHNWDADAAISAILSDGDDEKGKSKVMKTKDSTIEEKLERSTSVSGMKHSGPQLSPDLEDNLHIYSSFKTHEGVSDVKTFQQPRRSRRDSDNLNAAERGTSALANVGAQSNMPGAFREGGFKDGDTVTVWDSMAQSATDGEVSLSQEPYLAVAETVNEHDLVQATPLQETHGAPIQSIPPVQPKFDPYTGAPIQLNTGAPMQSSVDAQSRAFQKKVKKEANVSMILGIIGLFVFGFIFGPFAIYYGLKAKKAIKNHPEQFNDDGKCQANAGFILGIIDTFWWVVLIIIIIVGG